jgi:glycosyltransferase involved in cell wall biosynthesis
MPALVVLSHLRWKAAQGRMQPLLTRLARHHRVLFIEEPLRCEAGAWLACSDAAPGVTLLQPHTPLDARGFHGDQMPMLRPLIADALEAHGLGDWVAWLCTPMALPVLSGLAPRAVVYDCADDLSVLADTPREWRRHETILMESADLVFAGGASLFEDRQRLNACVRCLPSGVEARHFSPQAAAARLDAMLQAERVQGRIAGPRLGFCGAIDERVDIQLLAGVADARPDWQLLMAGPVAPSVAAQLPQRENIHWLGAQPPGLLPQLVGDWDLCLLPFVLDDTTRLLSPEQTLGYMAAEKPVVASAVPDVVTMYGDVVRVAHDLPGFLEACEWALSETPQKRSERVGEMLATVARHSWDDAVHKVNEALACLPAAPQRDMAVPASSDGMAEASLPPVVMRRDRRPAAQAGAG